MKKLNGFRGFTAIVLLLGISGLCSCPEPGPDRPGTNYVPPEDKPDAERWGGWVDDDATATLDYSVDAEGVCTITVGGTAQSNDESDGWGRWKASPRYHYTVKKNTNYTYVFEAWTEHDSRDITVQYYEDNDDSVYKSKTLSITSERKTYTIVGEHLPKGGENLLAFQCADQLGVFYIKILSITEGGDYDYVKIQSVTPSTGLTDGVEQQFTVKVDYALVTLEQGLITAGFNGDNIYGPNSFSFEEFDVNKGKGSHTFYITVVPKDWGVEGEFCAAVNLGHYPDGTSESWEWLAHDEKILSFK